MCCILNKTKLTKPVDKMCDLQKSFTLLFPLLPMACVHKRASDVEVRLARNLLFLLQPSPSPSPSHKHELLAKRPTGHVYALSRCKHSQETFDAFSKMLETKRKKEIHRMSQEQENYIG